MSLPHNLLPKDFDRELFLREYWQKKPLLIRAQGEAFVDPISPDELAGLACEDCVESRLVIKDQTSDKWSVETGPFEESRFETLVDGPWSLLVQAVDQWHEEVRGLLAGFDFIPNWRIDDVMISYSEDGGGVGPHFDYYDVFLIQGSGQKRWSLGGYADSRSECLDNNALRLLAKFETVDEWILNPGDILYLPPNYAHHGVSIGKSLTYSIGFRAPSVAEIIDDYFHELIPALAPEARYLDASPKLPSQSGEMTLEVGQQLSALLGATLTDPERLANWFARYMTRPKYPELTESLEHPLGAAEFAALSAEKGPLLKNPSSRFAFSKSATGYTLFADGEALACGSQFIDILPTLCDTQSMDEDWGSIIPSLANGAEIAASLYNQGSLLFAEDYEEQDE
jgi:50S ribosomal protein L16 3-hydroxylase